ncbi:sodium/potassium/calcium exchanger 1-like [Panicum hallii]|uniref:sodium/potassium/calcium exchanger 1-like n=1 Tax=Panicum hallii TaxID=206008 RepID=UPI000DF4D2ED|nr:sodium/potassium/calcium exchanger 1-like [Panicum hallii]
MPNYERWYEHGKSQEQEPYNLVDSFEENEDRMDAMMDDFVQQVENAAERVCPPGRLPIPGDEGYDECELDRTVPEAFHEDECNGTFEVDIGMALDRLDGDTGDLIVSEDEIICALSEGEGKEGCILVFKESGKKNDGSASSDRPSLFRGSSSHLSRRSALQRCLDEAVQEGRGADEEEYVANVDGDGDGGSGEGDGCEDREECEDGDGDAEEEEEEDEEEDTAAQPVFRYL